MEVLVSLLIFLVGVAIVLWLVSIILDYLPLSQPIRNVILALIALIALVYFLQRFGLLGAL